MSLLKYSFLHRWPYRVLILALALAAILSGLLSPFFQKSFVDRLMGSPTALHGHGAFNWMEGCSPLVLITLAFCCTILAQAMSLLNNYIGVQESLNLQRGFGERLYDKTLALRADRLSGTTIGEVVSIYATDVSGAALIIEQSIPMAAGIFFPLLLAPIAIQWIIGIPLQNTLLVMGFMIVLNLTLATRQSRFFSKFKALAADRTGLVNEWVQNLRLLRILGWVENYEAKIFKKREEETENRVGMVTNGQFMNSIGSSITYVINLTGVGALVFFRKDPVTAGELFALLWIFGAFLTRPFRQFPWLFTMAMDSFTSLRRLQNFLNRYSDDNGPLTRRSHLESPKVEGQKQGLALEVRGLNLELSGKKRLDEVSFNVKAGEFVAVIGEVGSGKSLLVLSLLGETGASFQALNFGDSPTHKDGLLMSINERRQLFAFVPQEGFVISASLRENVAFEYDVQAEIDAKVRRALTLSQFNVATEYVQAGLDTEIGERGVNLSGGQRQRVSLARAEYYDRPVLILDDCLSALDVDTEAKLIRDLVCGSWKNKTRLLITHRLSVLAKVDRILFLEKGRILEDGTFDQLMARSPRMREFVASVRRSEGEQASLIDEKGADYDGVKLESTGLTDPEN